MRAEVEGRGSSWLEFQSADELKESDEERLVNGTGPTADGGANNGDGVARSSAWTDGTFQTGRIVNGEVRMDGDEHTNGSVNDGADGTAASTGGRLDDEALR